jgi:branched-chain amino acid transport system ATP-binding protein
MSAAAIEAQDLSKHFGGVHAVEDVTVSIAAGEIRGLIGPNGAGKTTLLNLLSGVARPSGGTVRAGGREVTGWPLHRMVRDAHIVRTFQTVRLFDSMSVLENVTVAAGTRRGAGRRTSGAVIERAREILEELELGPMLDSPVTELAYGTRRWVEIARALVTDPKVLLLDEPAAGLNTVERESLGALLRRLRDGGMTVVLVEHQMDLVGSVCDGLTVLDFGRVICEGPPQQVIEDERVLSAYLGAAPAAV